VAAGELGPIRVLHGTYLQDWLLGPDDTNWRVDDALGGPSRAFADIGSHWCDLVEFTSGTRISRLLAHTSTTVAARATGERATFAGTGTGATDETGGAHGAGGADGSVRAGTGATSGTGGRAGDSTGETSGTGTTPVRTEDVALVLFETDGGGTGSVVVSQVAAGRKNRLWFELDGERASLAFDQENPETLWLGRRSGATLVTREADHLAPDAARLATLPAGHGQGYHDCFDLFVADAYAAMAAGAGAAGAAGAGPEGLPLIADGVRAARITDAVVASARTRSWTEVPT
jgi:predicted dehydrogenase